MQDCEPARLRETAEQIASPDSMVNFMTTRVALGLVCLVAFLLLPLAGCTPPASQDVQFTGGSSVTGSGSCCPGSTGMPATGPGSTAGNMAAAIPGTTAS